MAEGDVGRQMAALVECALHRLLEEGREAEAAGDLKEVLGTFPRAGVATGLLGTLSAEARAEANVDDALAQAWAEAPAGLGRLEQLLRALGDQAGGEAILEGML